jgi:SAM-dependent methyltransferase
MKIAMCCAADEKTKYLAQALRWAQSIRTFGASADPFVGLTDPCPDYYRDELHRLGVRLVPVPRASDWHGPSNKLGVLLEPDLSEYDFVILSDCDIAVVGDISDQLLPGRIRAKPADLATLGNAVLEGVFASAGQRLPSRQVRTSIDRVDLHPYCNSGFIVFSGELLKTYMERWLHWNEFILANSSLLGERVFFSDQASFALALAEAIDRYEELPIDMNFPCHMPASAYPVDLHEVEPRILHYHDQIDWRTGLLIPIGLPGPDRIIERHNASVLAERRLRLCNPVFWDEYYLRVPENDGRLGAPDEHYNVKTRMVAEFLRAHQGPSVVDFGCGQAAMHEVIAPDRRYTGVDGSREVIERNRKRFPDSEFHCQQLQDCSVSAPLSFCFNVLIHQCSREEFDAVIDGVIAHTTEAGLINGFDQDPGPLSGIDYFHQPLGIALAERDLKMRRVAVDGPIAVYEWWR